MGLFICIEHGFAFYFCIHTHICVVQQIICALYSKRICAFSVFPFNFSLNKISICSCGCQPADILILWSPVLMYSSFLLVFLLPFSEKPICFWHLLTIIFYELPGKKPIQRRCQCQLLCQNITLVTSDSLQCADLHCVNALEQCLFLSLLQNKLTLVFLRQQYDFIDSNNHYWTERPAHEIGTNALLI